MAIFRANFAALNNVHDRLATYGVKPHPAVAHGFALHKAITATNETPDVRMLDLTPDEAVRHILDKSNRALSHINASRVQADDQLTREVFDVFKGDVDRIITELRPAFNKAATAIRQAISAGITPGMTADKVLTLESPDAITMWKDLPAHLDVIRDIADIRIDCSEEIGVEPQPYNAAAGAMNYGACFIKPTGAELPEIVAAHLRRGLHVFLRPDLHLATQDEMRESLRLQRDARGAIA
jgi:hypothetical protein